MKGSNIPRESWFVNHQIKLPKVVCIDHTGANLGLISTSDAIKKAREVELDLVQILPPQKDKPATCKIMDFGKFKFESSKKKKEAEKKQRENAIKLKTIQLHPGTAQNDLNHKAKQANEFLKMLSPYTVIQKSTLEGKQLFIMIGKGK